MAKATATESLPALYPQHSFDSRETREMSIMLGSGPYARDILIIDQFRRELIGIASEGTEAGRETHVTFTISFEVAR